MAHPAPLPGEGVTRVPPRRHLRKLVARLERLRDAEPRDLDEWRLKAGGGRLEWVSQYDDFIENTTELLAALLGTDDQEDE